MRMAAASGRDALGAPGWRARAWARARGPRAARLAASRLGGGRETGHHREAEGDRLAAAGAAAAEDVTAGERVGQGCDLDRERLGDAALGEHRDECGGYSEGFERRAGVAVGPCMAQGCSRTCRAQMVFLIVRAGRLRSPDVLDGSDALEARLRTTSVPRRGTRPSHHARWIHGTAHSTPDPAQVCGAFSRPARRRRWPRRAGGRCRSSRPAPSGSAASSRRRDVARAEVGRIALVELLGLVQLGVAAGSTRSPAARRSARSAAPRRARRRSASGARS